MLIVYLDTLSNSWYSIYLWLAGVIQVPGCSHEMIRKVIVSSYSSLSNNSTVPYRLNCPLQAFVAFKKKAVQIGKVSAQIANSS